MASATVGSARCERRIRLTMRMKNGRVSVKGDIPPFLATQAPVRMSKAS